MAYSRALTANDYQIGWIAALAIERAAATALLDERHAQPLDFVQHHADNNSYTWGRISDHNIVIASLASGVYGLTSATTTALGLVSSFPAIKAGLLVGIGAGVPESGLDIRLGDVAVSVPNSTYGGVVQYDTGKAKDGNIFERTGIMVPPPSILLNALAKLRAEHELEGTRIPMILDTAYSKYPKFAQSFKHPGSQVDYDPQSDISGDPCTRVSVAPEIHYGTIASGNMLVKDSSIRQEIFEIIGPSCICIEMEAGGLMNSFPCLVVRGICDYADPRKNDIWQRYASITAAAFAKELMCHVPREEVVKSTRIEDAISEIRTVVQQLEAQLGLSEKKQDEETISKFLQALYTCPYADRKNRNIQRVVGTCEWFTTHPLYSKWLNGNESNLLWVSADPGCGKSVLARFLVDEQLRANNRTICYFFFKEDFADQRSSSSIACALLRQTLDQKRYLISQSILDRFETAGAKFVESFEDVWETLVSVLANKNAGEIFLVVDALDECQKDDRRQLIEAIHRLQAMKLSNIKVLMTSRPYHQIQDYLGGAPGTVPVIHLSGDSDMEREMITKEIDIVIRQRVYDFSSRRGLTNAERDFLLERLTAVPQRTYLWVHLTLEIIEETPGFTRHQARNACEELPASVDEAYEKILSRSSDQGRAKILLQCIVASWKPLTVSELSLFLVVNEHSSVESLEEQVEPPERFRVTVRDLCGLFVIVVDDQLYLLHQTVREFLLAKEPSHLLSNTNASIPWVWRHSLQLQVAHRVLAERCLWILQPHPQFHDGYTAYAAAWWPQHFAQSDITASERIVQLAASCCATDHGMLNRWLKRYEIVHWIDDFVRVIRGQLTRYDITHYPIILASHLDLAPVVEQILTTKALDQSIKTRCLTWTTFHNFQKVSKILLRHNTNPNETSSTWRVDFKQYTASSLSDGDVNTPVHHAARHGDTELQKLLLDLGGDPNGNGVNERRPLHEAALHPDLKMIQMLVQRGADRNAEDCKRRTPMHFFCGLAHEHDLIPNKSICQEILEALWNHDVSLLNEKDRDGQTCLHYASKLNCKECTTFLLQNGASCKIRARDGRTALFEASYSNSPINAESLLDAGAEVNAVDGVGISPLMVAVQSISSSAALTTMLLEKGANIDAKNADDARCIHLVRNVGALRVLLKHGADINSRNSEGETPLMYVAQGYWLQDDDKRSDMYTTMLELGANPMLRDKTGHSARWNANKLDQTCVEPSFVPYRTQPMFLFDSVLKQLKRKADEDLV